MSGLIQAVSALAAAVWLSNLLCPWAARAAESPPPAIQNLASLTRRALKHFPSVQAADHAVQAAEAKLREATFSPFFQFHATGTFTMAPEAKGTPIFSPDNQLPLTNAWRPIVGGEFEGAVPIYTFGKLQAARQAARAGVGAAGHRQRRTKAQVRFDVRRAYYALQFALDVQQMIQEGQSKLESAARQLDERLESNEGEANPMDRWRLASTLAEVEARASEATELETSSRYALSVLSGVSAFRVPACPSSALPFELGTLDQYRVAAAAQRPESAMIREGLKAREASVQASRAGYFPDVALALRASRSVGPGVTDQTNPFIIDRANYTSLGAALVARWSLDFVGTASRLDHAKAQLRETQAQAEAARLGMDLEVTSTYRNVEDTKRRVAAWAEGHRQARAWFVASAQAYQIGTLEPKELVDAVKAYFSARFNHLDAIRAHNTALASLEKATGAPLLKSDEWEMRCE